VRVVQPPVARKLVIGERRAHLRLEVVLPRIVIAEDRGLDRAVGWSQRAEPYFFCMSSGISSRRSASICHCGEPVQIRVGAPARRVGAHALDQMPIIAAASAARDRRLREQLADVGIDVGDAVLLRDLGEVADPVDASGLLELRPPVLGAATGRVR
jgi:hypothetical protein